MNDPHAGIQHICVQSMDGQLAFYEKETCAFTRFLPGFLVPGPLCYCPQLDAIITCNAAFKVECYKYQALAAAQAAADKGDLLHCDGHCYVAHTHGCGEGCVAEACGMTNMHAYLV